MESTQAQTTTTGDAVPPVEEPLANGLVPTPNGAVAIPDGTDFGDDAGAGFEGTRMEEQTTPFLRMAQGLSPELNPGKGEHIPGLMLGDVFNTATRGVYNGREGVEMVICWKDYGYGQWIPRDLGSGFRGALSPDDQLVRSTLARMASKYGSSARFKMPRYKNGSWSDDPALTRDTNEAVELVETGQFYVLYAPGKLTGGNFQRAIVAFTSTALAAYNSCVTRHLNQLWPQRDGSRKPAPIYAYKWRLTTFQDKRGQNEFYNWKIDLAAQNDFLGSLYAKTDPALFTAAREFFDQARAGLVKAADPAAAGQPTDDEVPF